MKDVSNHLFSLEPCVLGEVGKICVRERFFSRRNLASHPSTRFIQDCFLSSLCYCKINILLMMCWICTCFMELGVLALMFAPSYQLISCGSLDRGLLIALIIWCCSHTLSSQFLFDSNLFLSEANL